MVGAPGVVTVLRVERVRCGPAGRRVECRRCGQEEWLRLVAVGRLAVVWCDQGHVTVAAGVTPEVVARQVMPGMPVWWRLVDGAVPEAAEREHPGLAELLRELGSRWRSVSGGDLAPPGEQRYRGRREWRAFDEVLSSYLDEEHRGGEGGVRDDEIVLVPMSRRELRMLDRHTYRPDHAASLVERVIRTIVRDVEARADDLVGTDEEHVRQVVAEHSAAVDEMLRIARWRHSAQRWERQPPDDDDDVQ